MHGENKHDKNRKDKKNEYRGMQQYYGGVQNKKEKSGIGLKGKAGAFGPEGS
jgi:hypothetical protein